MSELNPTFFPNDDMTPNQEWNTDLPPVDFHLMEPERGTVMSGDDLDDAESMRRELDDVIKKARAGDPEAKERLAKRLKQIKAARARGELSGEIPKTKARIEKRPTGRAAPTRPLVKSDDMGLFGFLLGGAALIGVGVFVGSKRK